MDEGDIILNLILGLGPVAQSAIMWTGFACTVIVGFITLSPWKGDDEVLEKVKKMPVIGKLLAALMKFTPWPFKKD